MGSNPTISANKRHQLRLVPFLRLDGADENRAAARRPQAISPAGCCLARGRMPTISAKSRRFKRICDFFFLSVLFAYGFGCSRIAVWAILYLRFGQAGGKVLDVDQAGFAQTTAFALDAVQCPGIGGELPEAAVLEQCLGNAEIGEQLARLTIEVVQRHLV